jgi:hypothetical protein
VSRVSYLGVNSEETADAVAANVENDSLFMLHRSNAEPFDVEVGFSLHTSMLGLRRKEFQEYSHLVVVLCREDGSRSVHKLPVPHRTVVRRVVVTPENAI